MFCGDCIHRGCEVAIGDNKTKLICFVEHCQSEFSLETLRAVLKPKLYHRLIEKKQTEEIAIAGIQNLYSCPACDYAVSVPDSDTDKLFYCQRSTCLKVTCKQCKE